MLDAIIDDHACAREAVVEVFVALMGMVAHTRAWFEPDDAHTLDRAAGKSIE